MAVLCVPRIGTGFYLNVFYKNILSIVEVNDRKDRRTAERFVSSVRNGEVSNSGHLWHT
jgi:hypothetical protein